ncbi:YajG family lipoprotein [Rheinheimera maricola]|uniref:YajG family lipoprotein n=1 Tax=Rheinheimera maricola TaxID=2793282 RepID=A0ABS7X6F0_9GAMM|nr:YajG family lipoprotein [Rheinheimera maricola]MBZ9611124.1 YajG family lipoprotein [Rheinheimera maricola]
MRLLLLVVVLLAGCSSPTPSFILSPQVFWPQSNQLQQSSFAFNVSDERGVPYSLRLRNGDKVQHIKTQNDLRAQLEQTLSQVLSQQGASLNSNSAKRMTVKIVQLQALVEQHTLEHAVTNQVAFTVSIQHDQGTFSKTYSGDSSFTAPFKMDVAAVERELRVLIEQVLAQLLQDTSWKNELRG